VTLSTLGGRVTTPLSLLISVGGVLYAETNLNDYSQPLINSIGLDNSLSGPGDPEGRTPTNLTSDWAGTNVGGSRTGLNGFIDFQPVQQISTQGADTMSVLRRRKRNKTKRHTGKKMYANITVASLNTRGHGKIDTMNPHGR
jgi:exonuclease III